MDDEKIIALYWDRSEEAISQTSEKYGRYCRAVAYSILKSDEEAEECTNDTYLRAWNAIPPAKPNNLRTFLGKITRNLSLNRWEKLSAEKRGGGEVSVVLDELAECVPSSDDTESAAEDALIRDALDRFLKGLPRETRKIFVRRYWYMSPIKEIAEDFGFTENKVSVALYRTREKLRKTLEKEGILL